MYTTGQTCAIATITLASSSMVSPIRKDAPSESPKSLQRKGIMRRSDPIGGEEKNNGVVGSIIIIIIIPYHTTDMTLDSPLRGVIPQVVTHRSLFLIQVVVLSGRQITIFTAVSNRYHVCWLKGTRRYTRALRKGFFYLAIWATVFWKLVMDSYFSLKSESAFIWPEMIIPQRYMYPQSAIQS